MTLQTIQNDSKRFTYSIADVLRSVVMNASDPGKY